MNICKNADCNFQLLNMKKVTKTTSSYFVRYFAGGILFFIGCTPLTQSNGPYFGNGFRNGWADQHSISIWTRLTSIPDLNESGIHFKDLSQKEHQELRKETDIDRLHAAQIPEGYRLAELNASCPGAYGEVKLIYHPLDDPVQKSETEWSAVDSTRNYSKQWKLIDLSPNTIYQVNIFARENESVQPSDTIMGQFRTPPDANSLDEINFSVVTGHDYNRRDNQEGGHQIYHSMLDDSLDFYVHTGDIEYYDKPNPWALTEPLMYFKWDRLFALPFQRNFYRQTTSYFIKDDHDALSNDCYPGMTYGAVSFDRGLEIFDQEQFPTRDTTYKTIRWGKDLQIWIMEGRKYRSKNSDPDGPDKTIWGKTQKEWLYHTIKNSDAAIKVIISATPVLGPDRGNKNDNHANQGFTYEGNEIRNFVNQFDNVFFCVGDRHWQYVSHIEHTNLWEFSCGPGSDQHAGGWNQKNVLPEHQFLRVKGGYLHASVYREKNIPSIKFQHRNVDGITVNEKVFTF